MDPGLRNIVTSRLAADASLEDAWGALVLGALAGRDGLEAELAGVAASPAREAVSALPTPAGAYLRSIVVEGFRGIGPPQVLDLAPGPGLTLVVGRNGSGKSSFAEALEVLLTGDSLRWKERAAVWREGWRNLHHPVASLSAVFLVEGEPGPCVVTRRWEPEAPFEAAEAAAEIQGKPRSDLHSLGWTSALRTHRPFLSYNELGSLLDEGPSKLYDALSSILGLEDLVQAQGALQEARRSREKAIKDATEGRVRLLERLGSVEDGRAQRVVAAIEGTDWDLASVEGVLAGAGLSGGGAGETDVLRRIASLEPPDPARVAAAAAEMRAAAAAVGSARGTAAARSRDAAALLDLALGYHAAHGDGDCPVCGHKAALDGAWSKRQRTAAGRLREAAREAEAVHERAEAARRSWEGLAVLKAEALQRAVEVGLDMDDLVAVLGIWVKAGSIADLGALASHVESASGPLRDAVVRLRDTARAELGRREDAWRPVATGRIQLTGDGTRRRVVLDVTVDGVEGAALGVMSQGELHSLALSLFVPRATLPESPFRFIVIDDPVQSMDPARVDGLARVLEGASADRQVVVFTHDDRLPEAVRRLDIPAEIVEVTRREASVVELRRALDPVGRYLEDALAVAGTSELPSSSAERVVVGLCRLALEAACMEVVRRRRLGRGEAHAEVERALAGAGRLTRLCALALFDDVEREGEALPRIEREAGSPLADVFRRCNEEAHDVQPGAPIDVVRQAGKLAAWLRGLK
jgi:energy-coupling factor transporter ATP-binding protein EcfA2